LGRRRLNFSATVIFITQNSLNRPLPPKKFYDSDNPDNSKLIQLQQEPQNLRRLENTTIDISEVIYNVQAWEKSGIALLVNGYSYSEIRPKLLSQGKKNFTSFSDYIKDIHLDKFFYEKVTTEFDIFKLDLKTPKLHQEGQLQTFV